MENSPGRKTDGSHPLFSDSKISIADIFRNVNRSLPTRGAWIEIEVESREPSAEGRYPPDAGQRRERKNRPRGRHKGEH